MGYHGVMLRWLLGMHPLTWMGIPWWPSLGLVIFLWLFVSASQAWVIGAWAWALARTRLGGYSRVLYAVGVWLGLHWLWGLGSTAFPWDDLAQTQTQDLWLIQIAALGSSALVTALLIAVGGLLGESWSRRNGSYGVVALTLLAVAHGYGLWSTRLPAETGERSLRVGVIQGNIPQTRKWSRAGRLDAYETYLRGYDRLARQGVDLVLVPETAIPVVWSREADPADPLVERVRSRGTTLLLGAFDALPEGQLTTSLLALDRSGQVVSSYAKQHLVPLGEQIPLKEYIGWLIRKLSPLKGELVPGSPDQRFETPSGLLAGGICFDSAFGEGFRRQVAAGARLLITATNDAWFGPAMAPEHHALDTLRAVETGRWLVRASNNGTSGVIDPVGRTILLTEWNTDAEFVATVKPLTAQTFYVCWGDWVTPVAGLVACAVLILAKWDDRRSRP